MLRFIESNKMPNLSIITINYNNLAGLQKTMQSVFEQSFSDYEYIIIDGGSKDGSKEYIEQYKDRLAYWVSEKDKGIYDAMNKAILQSRGCYLEFLNSGDVFCSSNVLDECFNIIKDQSCDIVYGQIRAEWQGSLREIIFPSQMSLYFLKQYAINHQACFYKRTFLNQIGYYNLDYSLAADYELMLRCVVGGATFQALKFPIVEYDMNGVSSNKMDKYIDQMKQAFLNTIPASINNDLLSLASSTGKNSWRRFLFPHPKEDYKEFFPERNMDY